MHHSIIRTKKVRNGRCIPSQSRRPYLVGRCRSYFPRSKKSKGQSHPWSTPPGHNPGIPDCKAGHALPYSATKGIRLQMGNFTHTNSHPDDDPSFFGLFFYQQQNKEAANPFLLPFFSRGNLNAQVVCDQSAPVELYRGLGGTEQEFRRLLYLL
ncbi:hypothetical protein AVEN_192406-1 [Araneus ventricosus]|uniref:Uncharacterized protein n=1 Tax=Araneus ventricosus TaxID=182803 RepID=A0A4Y2W6B2_ARAVE|nr:hypothetical protein AVEN_192406-1 [Araneus ventricosus]